MITSWWHSPRISGLWELWWLRRRCGDNDWKLMVSPAQELAIQWGPGWSKGLPGISHQWSKPFVFTVYPVWMTCNDQDGLKLVTKQTTFDQWMKRRKEMLLLVLFCCLLMFFSETRGLKLEKVSQKSMAVIVFRQWPGWNSKGPKIVPNRTGSQQDWVPTGLCDVHLPVLIALLGWHPSTWGNASPVGDLFVWATHLQPKQVLWIRRSCCTYPF